MDTFASEFTDHLNRLSGLSGKPGLGCFKQLIHLKKTTSTNACAWELFENNRADHGTAIIADVQTAGKGRFGRTWVSATPKGLYASILLTPEPDLKIPHILTTAAAIAIAETIREFYKIQVRIRWPNDIVSDGKKLAGVLVDTKNKAGKPKAYALGMGVNLNHCIGDFPPELEPIATSLHILSDRQINRASFAAQLVSVFSKWYGHVVDEQYELLSREWQELSALINKRVNVIVNNENITGRVIDLHITDGIILQLDAGGIRAFRSEFVEKLSIN